MLHKLETIECRDALLNADGSEAVWPEADVIVGNPPFLGGKRLRDGLGDGYVEELFAAYKGRVPAEADFVCYWVEKAWRAILLREAGEGDHAQHGGGGSIEPTPQEAVDVLRTAAPSPTLRVLPLPRSAPLHGGGWRAGLVTTNSIRGGANRRVLEPIASANALREAWSDEAWFDKGVAVRVSMLGFGESFIDRRLNGTSVETINTDLTGTGIDLTKSSRLKENAGVAFMGDTKGGAFDVPGELAREWLRLPLNPNGRPNSDVLKPWRNAMDVTRRAIDKWIIDFGWQMSEAEAALYEQPFQFALRTIKPGQVKKRTEYTTSWWRHTRPRPEMWVSLRKRNSFIATPTVAKHRVFVSYEPTICPDHQLIVLSKDDPTALGVVHSKFHELWSLRLGTWLGAGNDPRYTPSTTFETFRSPKDSLQTFSRPTTPTIPAHRRSPKLPPT